MPAADQNAVYVAVVIAILGFMIGLAKGGFGGLGALLTPLLALVLPVALAVGVLLPMLMVGDVFIARRADRHVFDRRLRQGDAIGANIRHRPENLALGLQLVYRSLEAKER